MSEPMALWTARVAAPAEAPRCARAASNTRVAAIACRGCCCFPPKGTGRFPLVLLQHGAGGSKRSDYLDAARLPWVQRGVAVASIDFPLHGERASAKLSEQFLAATVELRAIRPRGHDRAVERILTAGRRRSRARARRARRHPRAGRGAHRLRRFQPRCDPRARSSARPIRARAPPRSRSAAPASARPTSTRLRASARFAPRPLLFVNATRDERIPRAAAEALHAAAREPKEIAWFECGHHDLPGAGLKAMWTFLARAPRTRLKRPG